MKKKESDLLELQKLQQKLDQLSQSSSSCQKDPLQPIAHHSLLSSTGVYLQYDLLVCMWGCYKLVFSSWYFPGGNYGSYHPEITWMNKSSQLFSSLAIVAKAAVRCNPATSGQNAPGILGLKKDLALVSTYIPL